MDEMLFGLDGGSIKCTGRTHKCCRSIMHIRFILKVKKICDKNRHSYFQEWYSVGVLSSRWMFWLLYNYMRKVDSMLVAMNLRTSKAGTMYTELKHLWLLRDISLKLEDRAYRPAVSSRLLYGWDTDDDYRSDVFNKECLHITTINRWNDSVNSVNISSIGYMARGFPSRAC